jgi:glycosyltransferase involved in cell wall biosynthesis
VSSIVIPAHDEAGAIDRLLTSLAPLRDDIEIVVVCNGCTDDTAARARAAAPWARVVELDEASKPGALDAGDAIATSFPRAYIDADVLIDAPAARALLDGVREGAEAVGATPVHDVSASSAAVRAHYAIWSRMPANVEGIAGTNAMAVSAEGRARFDSWPRFIGDDYFLDGQFGPAEKRRIPDAVISHPAPRGLRDCVSRKARIYQGNVDVLEHGLRPPHTGGGLRGALTVIRDQPRLAVCLPAHLFVTVAAKLLVRWRQRRGTAQVWYRDRARDGGGDGAQLAGAREGGSSSAR